MTAASAAQLAATRMVQEVIYQRRSLGAVMDDALETLGERDRSLAAQLCYGTLRWYLRFLAVLRLMLDTPLRRRDSDVESLLLLGLFELESLIVSFKLLEAT